MNMTELLTLVFMLMSGITGIAIYDAWKYDEETEQ